MIFFQQNGFNIRNKQPFSDYDIYTYFKKRANPFKHGKHSEYATWLEAKYSTVNNTVWSSVHLHDIAPTVEMSPCNALGYVPKGLDFGAIPCQQAWVPSLNDKVEFMLSLLFLQE